VPARWRTDRWHDDIEVGLIINLTRVAACLSTIWLVIDSTGTPIA
jgi:hypothetical protein